MKAQPVDHRLTVVLQVRCGVSYDVADAPLLQKDHSRASGLVSLLGRQRTP
jgi:hypothetical protein